MSIQRMPCFFFNLGYSSFTRPKNDSSPAIWGASFRNLACGPTKLTRTKGFVNLVNINDSSCSDRTMSIQRPSCFFNLWSSCSSAQSSAGRAACSCLPWPAVLPRGPHRPYYSHRWPGYPSTHPHPYYSAATAASHRSRTSQPSYYPPHVPRLRVVPCLTVVHRLVLSTRCGQRGQ